MTFILLLLPVCIFVLPGSSTMATTALNHHSINNETPRQLHLPHGHHGVSWCLRGCPLLLWYLYVSWKCIQGGVHALYLQVVWRAVLTHPDLRGAVIHPVIYLSLRGERGIRIRNIVIGFVWLLSSVGISLMISDDVSLVMYFCALIFCLTVVALCSLSVLCVLICLGPGKQWVRTGRGLTNWSRGPSIQLSLYW